MSKNTLELLFIHGVYSMWPVISSVVSLFSGGLTNWLEIRKKESDAAHELKMAQLTQATELAKNQNDNATASEANKLAATSQGFKQGIFYWFTAIIAYSILLPDRAETLWHNYALIPDTFQYLYTAMVAITWGIPITTPVVTSMFDSIGKGLQRSRDYKLEKTQIEATVQAQAFNQKLFFDTLKPMLFQQGYSQEQVTAINKALKAAGINIDDIHA